ncbi:MAG TPA: hypothetical protein VIW45_03295, partial [Vicinamibacterales bacterium]
MNATPGIDALSASRASAVMMSVSCSEANEGAAGVRTIEPIRVRIACAELVTPVGVPFKTACALIAALPSRTPLASPELETVARV